MRDVFGRRRRRDFIAGVLAGVGLTYLLKDDFTTDDAAPLTSPRTAEPGPGTWTVTETNGAALDITASELVMTGNDAAYSHCDIVLASALTIEAGLAVSTKMKQSTVGQGRGYFYFTSNVGSPTYFNLGNNLIIFLGGSVGSLFNSQSTIYKTYTMVYMTGKVLFFVDNILIWVLYDEMLDCKPQISWFDSVEKGIFDNAHVATLSAYADSSFLTDAIAGSISAGQTFTHEADGWLTFDLDTLGGTNIWIHFRKQDSSNFWRLSISSGGGMYLIEVVAGTPTTRASLDSVLSGGEKIRIRFSGTTITGYYNNTQAWTYTGATNFQTLLDGELNTLGGAGAISDLETLPHNPSGTHLTQLTQIAAGT